MVEAQICAQPSIIGAPTFWTEVIYEYARFCALADEWDRLLQLAGIQNLFLSSTWFETWWELFGHGKQLCVITVRADGELIAAAPLMINQTRMYGIPVRRLESIYNFHTPRYDFIVARNHDDAYRMIWLEMSNAVDCDVALLTQIPGGSRTLPQMESLAVNDGWLSGKWRPPPSPFIRLGCDYGTFQERLTGHYRYNLRKRQERLARLGPVTVERITEKADVRRAMEDGLRIEAAAWKGERGTAMISDPKVAEFYTRFAERAAERGWLELMFLKAAGKRIAFDYVLRAGNSLCGVKIGYDPEYHSYSPGNMLLNLILKDACARKVTEYDFLGIDDEWKFDWTNDTREHEWLYLFRDNLRTRVLYHVKHDLLPRLKTIIRKTECTFLRGRV